jgi:hypothetical protein
MVSNVARAWVRTGADPRPLHVRHAEVADALVKIGGSGVYPVSEDAIDRMRADLERLKKPEAWDQRFVDAKVDFEDEIARHQRIREDILKEQRNLERLQQEDEHRILADITPTMMRRPEETAACVSRLFGPVRPDRPLLPGEVAKPRFDTAESYREARAMMLREVERLMDLKAAMTEVIHYTVLPIDQQNRRLIYSLFAMVNAMAERINYLEQQTRRIGELSKLARHDYPDGQGDYVLPETPTGQHLAFELITHLSRSGQRTSAWIFQFCRERAPWLDPNEIDFAHLQPRNAQQLGRDLELIAANRAKLGITTIAPCDKTPERRAAERKEKRRERDRKRQAQKREEKRGQTREQYEASSISKAKPWEAAGVSRRTWYRKRGTSTSPTYLPSVQGEQPVPRGGGEAETGAVSAVASALPQWYVRLMGVSPGTATARRDVVSTVRQRQCRVEQAACSEYSEAMAA